MTRFHFDADELLKDEIVLTKIDVVWRQLNTAVRMFFFGEDIVSLHTVTSAAHGVLRDVAHHQGIKKSFKDSPLIAESARSEYLRAVNYPQNFFKHAKSDPTARMAFRFNGTPFFILDALLLYIALDQDLTYEMRVFLMWVQLRFPDLLCLQSAEGDLKQIRDTTNDPAAFKVLARVLLNEQSELV